MTDHCLHLVKASSSLPIISHDEMKYPIIAEIDANCHMFKEREFSETLKPASGSVILGDRKTTLTIKEIGMVKCKLEMINYSSTTYVIFQTWLNPSTAYFFIFRVLVTVNSILLRRVTLFFFLVSRQKRFSVPMIYIWMQSLPILMFYLMLIVALLLSWTLTLIILQIFLSQCQTIPI
jgi:hypothetical protein